MLRAAALAIAALVAAPPAPAAAPVPVPSASPLVEIGRTRSRNLCTTLRENVAPALAKMIAADIGIETGRQTFNRMGRNEVMGAAGSTQFDRIKLGNAVREVARNVNAAAALLADPNRFPVHPATDDQRDAAEMKQQLQAIVDEQKDALNAMSGLLETDLLGEMQNDIPDGVKKALSDKSKPSSAPPPERTTYVDAAGVAASSAGSPMPTMARKAVTDRSLSRDSLFGRTIYDDYGAQLSVNQEKIAKVEPSATVAIRAAVADCLTTPAPARK